VARQDADALILLVESSFAADAVVIFPDGLPYGGRIEGARRFARLLAGLASGASSIGPQRLRLDGLIAEGDEVVARLTFDWHASNRVSTPSGALELWTFAEGKVTELKAYYWDTAACHDLFESVEAVPS
jgi:ketosteroid isomerase-like protein